MQMQYLKTADLEQIHLNSPMNNSSTQELGDPWSGIQRMILTQHADFIEWCIPCICEKENIYYLYDNTNFKKIEYEYIIREEASEYFKIICQCYRPLNLALQPPDKDQPLSSSQKDEIYQSHLIRKWIPPLASAQRQCQVPDFFCFAVSKQGVDVFLFDKDQRNQIGTIRQPLQCCSRSFCFPPTQELVIYDELDQPIYYISCNYWQLSNLMRNSLFCCRLCCCQFIQFDIYNAKDLKKVGFILNQYNGCLKECCTKGDKFIIEFPESAELFHKILIVYATVVIDYNMFENCCFNLP